MMSVRNTSKQAMTGSRITAFLAGTASGGDPMRPALRPFVTAGAVVGAGVIAVSSVLAPPTDMRTPDEGSAYPAVQLTAVASPIELYRSVVQKTLANAGAQLEQYAEFGSVVIGALIADPIGFSISTGFKIASLVGGAVIFFPIGALIPLSLAVYGTNAVSAVVNNGFGAAATALTNVVDAAVRLDPVDLFNAIVDIPAWIVGDVLNGNASPGLLGPFDPYSGGGGILAFFTMLAAALLLPLGGPPTPQATTLTMDAGVSLESDTSQTDSADSKSLPEASAQAEQELDGAVKGSADTVDGFTETTTDAREQADEGLDEAADEPAPAADGLIEVIAEEAERVEEEPGEVETEKLSGGTDLTDGNKVDPGTVPTASPVASTPDVETDVQERAGGPTTQTSGGAEDGDGSVDNASPSPDLAPAAPAPSGTDDTSASST